MKTYSTIGVFFAVLVVFSPCLQADLFNMGEGITNLEMVTVGNRGNLPDTRYFTPGFGGVDYYYNIGKYPITAAQYTVFLNAVAKTDTYDLYYPNMWLDPTGCKIQRTGSSGNYSYSVAADRANRPVNYIRYWDALRFANWLHNGMPTGEQDATTTEDGAYTIDGYLGWEGTHIVRNQGARWWIPDGDEWHKAAYFNPHTAGPDGSYWDYPTQTNEIPSNQLLDPDPGNNATFYCYFTYTNTIGAPYWRTEVGAHSNSAGPYGTFDQGGNVWEWCEHITEEWPGLVYRAMRGGSFGSSYDHLSAFVADVHGPPMEPYPAVGFRVASAYMPGDFNKDLKVNLLDFAILSSWWMDYECNLLNQWCDGADMNQSGIVDFSDLIRFARLWLNKEPSYGSI